MTKIPISLPTKQLYRQFQRLPGFVREVLIAIAILAVVLPPYKMLLNLYFISKSEQLNSPEFSAAAQPDKILPKQ